MFVRNNVPKSSIIKIVIQFVLWNIKIKVIEVLGPKIIIMRISYFRYLYELVCLMVPLFRSRSPLMTRLVRNSVLFELILKLRFPDVFCSLSNISLTSSIRSAINTMSSANRRWFSFSPFMFNPISPESILLNIYSNSVVNNCLAWKRCY